MAHTPAHGAQCYGRPFSAGSDEAHAAEWPRLCSRRFLRGLTSFHFRVIDLRPVLNLLIGN